MFLKFLKSMLPLAKAAAAATPNKVDDAAIALIEEILSSLPTDEAAALAHLAAVKAAVKP